MVGQRDPLSHSAVNIGSTAVYHTSVCLNSRAAYWKCGTASQTRLSAIWSDSIVCFTSSWVVFSWQNKALMWHFYDTSHSSPQRKNVCRGSFANCMLCDCFVIAPLPGCSFHCLSVFTLGLMLNSLCPCLVLALEIWHFGNVVSWAMDPLQGCQYAIAAQ